jgi:hypothetical protein
MVLWLEMLCARFEELTAHVLTVRVGREGRHSGARSDHEVPDEETAR